MSKNKGKRKKDLYTQGTRSQALFVENNNNPLLPQILSSLLRTLSLLTRSGPCWSLPALSIPWALLYLARVNNSVIIARENTRGERKELIPLLQLRTGGKALMALSDGEGEGERESRSRRRRGGLNATMQSPIIKRRLGERGEFCGIVTCIKLSYFIVAACSC